MARSVNEKEYSLRKNQILDSAQRLIYTRGYEQMTIQEILEDSQISKGAFFYYFDSKRALLEALTERMMQEAGSILDPIVQDTQASALEKLHRYFDTVLRWKTSQKAFLIALLRVWYTDDNAIVRQKVNASGFKFISPFLTTILRQGNQEGVMHVVHPEQTGQVIFSVMSGFSDTLGERVLNFDPEVDAFEPVEELIAAYTEALERVLGVAPHSLNLINVELVKEWFVTPEPIG